MTAPDRRRRLARVFGDVVPDTTSEERADWGDRAGGAEGAEETESTEDWLRRQVPPHHG